jgi:hypothetical protein
MPLSSPIACASIVPAVSRATCSGNGVCLTNAFTTSSNPVLLSRTAKEDSSCWPGFQEAITDPGIAFGPRTVRASHFQRRGLGPWCRVVHQRVGFLEEGDDIKDGDVEDDDIAWPLHVLVEEGEHASVPDRNADGVYNPGYDVTHDPRDAWGIRDTMSGLYLPGTSYSPWMFKTRSGATRRWPEAYAPAASAPTSSKRLTSGAGGVSTESCELHLPTVARSGR